MLQNLEGKRKHITFANENKRVFNLSSETQKRFLGLHLHLG